jgi:hypothetical protein
MKDESIWLNAIAILIFAIAILKWRLHYTWLLGAYPESLYEGEWIPKQAIRKYILLFRSGIMFPVFTTTGDKKFIRTINLLVFSFYSMIVMLFLLIGTLGYAAQP